MLTIKMYFDKRQHELMRLHEAFRVAGSPIPLHKLVEKHYMHYVAEYVKSQNDYLFDDECHDWIQNKDSQNNC